MRHAAVVFAVYVGLPVLHGAQGGILASAYLGLPGPLKRVERMDLTVIFDTPQLSIQQIGHFGHVGIVIDVEQYPQVAVAADFRQRFHRYFFRHPRQRFAAAVVKVQIGDTAVVAGAAEHHVQRADIQSEDAHIVRPAQLLQYGLGAAG